MSTANAEPLGHEPFFRASLALDEPLDSSDLEVRNDAMRAFTKALHRSLTMAGQGILTRAVSA